MSIPQRNTTLILAILAVLALPLLFSAVDAGPADLETIDLADLADGETRTFGDDGRRVEATRDGDRVKLRILPADGDGGKTIVLDRELNCDLAAEDCTVLIGAAGEDHSMFVFRSSGGDDGEHVERHVEIVTGDGSGDHEAVVIGAMPRIRVLRVGPDGDDLDIDLEDLDLDLRGLDEAMASIRIPVPPVLIHAGPGERVLRCPEGDATLTVAEDEADDVFLCPKHSVAMEPFKRPHLDGFHWRMETRDREDEGNAPEL